ncbi:MAG: hypothetical protein ACTSR7_19100 [Promethearchaeota archaeon]
MSFNNIPNAGINILYLKYSSNSTSLSKRLYCLSKRAESNKIQDILNTINLPNNQKIKLQALVLRERTANEKNKIRERLVDDLMKSLKLNKAQMEMLQSDIFNKVRDSNLKNKGLIKGSLYETLINYYVEKELWFADYARHVERIGKEIKLTIRETKNYALGWGNDVKLIQRMCWAILFQCRHPITGVKMSLKQYLSFPLHHWMTESGHENQYVCLLSAVLPFPGDSRTKFGYPYHLTISNDVKNKNMGSKWQNDIAYVLNHIIYEGKAPETGDVIWNKNNRDNFNDYLNFELDENTRKFIISLLFISYL